KISALRDLNIVKMDEITFELELPPIGDSAWMIVPVAVTMPVAVDAMRDALVHLDHDEERAFAIATDKHQERDEGCKCLCSSRKLGSGSFHRFSQRKSRKAPPEIREASAS